MTNFECLSCLLALPFGTVEMTNFECVLCSCFVRHESRSRWRPSGWKRHSRHHQVAARRGCAGVFRLDHYGFGSRYQLCSPETHRLHFSVFDTLHEYEVITTLSPMPGQAALRRESGCSHRKALPGPRSSASSAPSTSSSSCRSVQLRVCHRRSERHTQTGKTHDICIYFLLLLTIDTSGRARGCCAGVLRLRAAAACWRSAWSAQALKTNATNSLLHICLAPFCHEGRVFSPLHEGLALCFVRLVSAPHSMLPLVYRLMGNSTFGRSYVHCCGLLLTPRFSPLPINVSDVDRHETSLFPGKMTSLSGS